MSGFRKAVYLAMSFAALAAAILMTATTARAQSDPFGALYAPPAGSGPAPSNRTGVTSVTGAVGRTYAGAQEGGFASLAQIGMLPRTVPAMPIVLKAWNPKFAAGRPGPRRLPRPQRRARRRAQEGSRRVTVFTV